MQAGFIVVPARTDAGVHDSADAAAGRLAFNDNLLAKGDVANGAKLMVSQGGCLGCHGIKGNPMMVGVIGPNLTHIATRTTIAAGLFPTTRGSWRAGSRTRAR